MRGGDILNFRKGVKIQNVPIPITGKRRAERHTMDAHAAAPLRCLTRRQPVTTRPTPSLLHARGCTP